MKNMSVMAGLLYLMMHASTSAQALPPLSDYAGKYPPDPELALPFLEHPLVIQAVEQTVPDAEIRHRLLSPAGPKTPIWISHERIHSWGCEAHNCGPHNWTISMKLDGSDPVICYHDQDTARNETRWFLPGRSEWRSYSCPAGPEDILD